MHYPQDTKKTILKYNKYLNGKNVVIVGPAPHLMDKKNGDIIDSYDIVVRVNKGCKIDIRLKDYLGVRMDVLYHTMFIQEESGINLPIEYFKNKLKWICASFPDKKHKPFIEKFINRNGSIIPFHIVDKKYWQSLSDKIEPPHAGVMAIFDLLKYNISKLFITGITFYQTTTINGAYYYDGYTKKNKNLRFKTSKHDHNKAFKYFVTIYKKDKRIRCDDVLEKIVRKRLIYEKKKH